MSPSRAFKLFAHENVAWSFPQSTLSTVECSIIYSIYFSVPKEKKSVLFLNQFWLRTQDLDYRGIRGPRTRGGEFGDAGE